MGKFNATNLIVEVDGQAIAHQTSASLNISQDLPDASTKDSGGYADHIHGQREWSIDVDGMTDFSASFGADGLADMILDRTTATVTFTTNETGETEYTGTVSLSDLTQESPLEDLASFSGTLVGKGALTKQAVTA